MKTNQPCPEELKIEAVKQTTKRGHEVAGVSAGIGVSRHSLYKWVKASWSPQAEPDCPLRPYQRVASPG